MIENTGIDRQVGGRVQMQIGITSEEFFGIAKNQGDVSRRKDQFNALTECGCLLVF